MVGQIKLWVKWKMIIKIINILIEKNMIINKINKINRMIKMIKTIKKQKDTIKIIINNN
jgi:hypothetical protein